MGIENRWALALISFQISIMVLDRRNGHVAATKKMGLSNDSNSSSVSAMYVLGDSSVDCGDNTPFYSLSHRNLSLFPCNGSDITLLPQIIAKKIGLPYTIPFYSQNGSIHAILGGVNFGSAEATILHPDSRGYQSLNQQLRQTFETIQLLQLQLGEGIANHFIQSSLFYLSFGKDDFIDYFLDNPKSRLMYTRQSFSHVLVHQMTNAIRDLYASNVRKIVCVGVLPLGCAPRVLQKWDYDSSVSESKGCWDEVNLMVLEYNTRLEENIVAINAELSDARIIFCDVYRAVMEFINHPKFYGLEDVKNACCGVGKYGGMTGCLSEDMACPQASDHVWWDLYNPTPTVNLLIAGSAWSGEPLSAICRPNTVQQLLSS